ncbi:hypothetical protein JL101_005420 [Skermanella rosea]|uniref:CsbD family protein n=1 Tax=Skermanella cutis TaxID=2775420 RepID=A0ABX7B288_9PROT|nr:MULTISPECIES: hypothetical protein [Skermanella]QQP88418.1 hypothetical protein IGS68_20585 [Skermanella sp. TT6]UEM04876.1 hypothetical protein JL101_005420 [Skermanella rosea]
MSTGKGSEAAEQIEKALDRKTGKASGDTDKSPERKFEEMGERDEIRDKAGRTPEGR